jgi:DNA polymerase III epsilon subunit-like protein
MANIMFVDTETTGLPTSMSAPYTDGKAWPYMLGVSWIVADENAHLKGEYWTRQQFIIAPRPGVVNNAMHINGITEDMQRESGIPISHILSTISGEILYWKPKYIVAHNAAFDRGVLLAESARDERDAVISRLLKTEWFCTKHDIGDVLGLPATEKQREYFPEVDYKFPSLDELYMHLFGKAIAGRETHHGAAVDVEALTVCYYKLKEQGIIK